MTSRTKKEVESVPPVEPATPPVSPATPSVEPEKPTQAPIGRLFWGLILVVIGGLVLLNNFGIVAVDWGNVWKLWPLGVIAAGVSVLSVRHRLWRVLSIILMVLTLGLIVYVAVGTPPSPSTDRGVSDTTISRQSDQVSRADVSIATGASQLKLTSADQSTIARSRLESNIMTLSQNSTVDGTVQRTTLSTTQSAGSWWIGDGLKTNWDVALTRSLPLDVTVDIGATDADIDLSRARLQSLDVTSGASQVMIKIGARENLQKVTIEAGASSVVVKVPKEVGVRLTLESGLAAKNVADLTETTEGVFESSDYASASQQLTIEGNVGVSSFSIERY